LLKTGSFLPFRREAPKRQKFSKIIINRR